MCLIGKVKTNSILPIVFISSALFIKVQAYDAGQMVPDQAKDADQQERWQDIEESPVNLPGSVGSNNFNDNAQASPFISGSSNDAQHKNSRNEDYSILGGAENAKSFKSYTNAEIVKPLLREGKDSYGLSYIYDSYTYKDDGNVFQQSIEDDSRGKKIGFLLLNYDRYVRSKLAVFTWGLNAGVGLNRGRGFFVDGTRSNTTFSFWMLPLEARLGFEIPVGRWGAIGFMGGPGVMGIIQSRNDFAPKERGKENRQASFGYFAGAKIKISMSNLNYDKGFDLYSDYKISNFNLVLELRNHNYSSFKSEDFSMTGTSMGIGVSFDYL